MQNSAGALITEFYIQLVKVNVAEKKLEMSQIFNFPKQNSSLFDAAENIYYLENANKIIVISRNG